MPLYAVRFRDCHSAVGFFYVENLNELTIAVDNFTCDPGQCEYCTVDYGGAIHWPSNVAWKIGDPDGFPNEKIEDYFYEADVWNHDRENKIRDDLEFVGSISDYLFGYKIKGWRPLPDYMQALKQRKQRREEYSQ
jgi:hypothetical protein